MSELDLDRVAREDHEHEFLSICCGRRWVEEVPGMCGQCHEWTGFECDCGKEWVYERTEQTDP